jgi:hypothetical protein
VRVLDVRQYRDAPEWYAVGEMRVTSGQFLSEIFLELIQNGLDGVTNVGTTMPPGQFVNVVKVVAKINTTF